MRRGVPYVVDDMRSTCAYGSLLCDSRCVKFTCTRSRPDNYYNDSGAEV